MRTASPHRRLALLIAGTTVCLSGAGRLEGQDSARLSTPGPLRTTALPPIDSLALLEEARDAQEAFERLKARRAPVARSRWVGQCDEIVGRMCMRLDGGSDWWPQPENDEVVAGRQALLDRLDQLAARLPGDGWILAQRVHYRVEGRQVKEARAVARRCGHPAGWWCDALEGYALHVAGAFPSAEAAFDRALAAMPGDLRTEWLDLEWLLEGEGLKRLQSLPDAEREAAIERWWLLADPFFTVPGNDFRTEILSRRTVARLRREAENAYRMRWRDDLEKLLVRYGWELGWERALPERGAVLGTTSAVGHQHPESREWTPPPRAVDRPEETDARRWTHGGRPRQRSGYAPDYAPVTSPADVVIRHYPRDGAIRLVADIRLDEDTTYHSRHEHPPLVRSPRWSGESPVVGLAAVHVETLERREVRGSPDERALALDLPTGRWVISAEIVDPVAGRAGRLRQGWVVEPPRRDLALLAGLAVAPATRSGEPPTTLEEFLEAGFVRSVRPGDHIWVGWEVWGMGWRPEELEYELTLERPSGGLFRRAGRAFGLFRRTAPVSLGWTEPGPERPGPAFRSLGLAVPDDLDDGEWILSVRVDTAGRSRLVAEQRLWVERPD